MRHPLTLRQAHIDAISLAPRDEFVRRLANYLKMHHPRMLVGVDPMPYCERVMELAKANNISEEEGVAWLCTLLLSGRIYGPNFPHWIVALLKTPDLDEEKRVQLVHDSARQLGWIA